MNTSSSSASSSVLSHTARCLCCAGLFCLLQGCTTLGIELVDSAELAELKSNAAPAEETEETKKTGEADREKREKIKCISLETCSD